MKLDFTGFLYTSSDSLGMYYDIVGFSPEGIPIKHRIYGRFEFPITGFSDDWVCY